MRGYTAEITTPFMGDGSTNNSYRPLLADTYTVNWQDITGIDVSQITPEPNAYTIAVTCDLATLQQIESDENFIVWWYEDEPEQQTS